MTINWRVIRFASTIAFLGAAFLPCSGQNAFQIVSGTLSQIAVGADGAVWGLDSSQRIFTWDSTSGQLVQIPGALTQIAVGNANAVWGVNAQQLIFHWNGGTQSWTYIPGFLTQIAVGADGDVWGVNAQNQAWHYDQQAQSWKGVSGSKFGFSQITVGNDGSVYALDNLFADSRQPYWYNPGTGQFQLITQNYTDSGGSPLSFAGLGSISAGADGDLWAVRGGFVCHYSPLDPQWNCMASTVVQIGVGSGGNVWGVDNNGQILRWNAQSGTWSSYPGALSQIAVGGAVWGVDTSNRVFQFTGGPVQSFHTLIQLPGSFHQISVAPDGTAWGVGANNLIYSFDRGTQSWQNVAGALAQVSVGSAGNGWGVNAEGQIWQWGQPAAKSWNYVEGELNQIAVSASGQVFGINASDQTYMYLNGWVEIPGALTQLSIGADGTTWGINAEQQIYSYYGKTESWANVPGSLVQISVGNANNIWGVNAEQQVYRYDTAALGWVSIPGILLTQVATAFDGAVWGVDAAGKLYQWEATAGTFNVIGTGVTNVAVANDNVVFAYNVNTGANYWYF
jgi:virginiamycin B lyase